VGIIPSDREKEFYANITIKDSSCGSRCNPVNNTKEGKNKVTCAGGCIFCSTSNGQTSNGILLYFCGGNQD